MTKPTCSKDCPQYISGGIGERACKHGHWDERQSHKKPVLEFGTFSVIAPQACSMSKKKNNNEYFMRVDPHRKHY